MTLEKTLLGLGGTRVVVQSDGYSELILNRGRVITPKKVKTKKGQPHECHLNTSLEYLGNHPAYQIVTGYSLAVGGLWVRHSWLQAPGEVILEMTGKRQLYFGVPLNEKETAKFVLDEIMPKLPGLKAWVGE